MANRARKNKSSDKAPTTKKKSRIICDLQIPRVPGKTGTLLVCGQGSFGQFGLGEGVADDLKRPTPNTKITDIVDICAGGMHSLCLKKDGTVYSFGCNDEGALGRKSEEESEDFVPKRVDLPGKCVKITAGDSHSAFLLEDGRVFLCGSFRNSHGSMGLKKDGVIQPIPIEILPNIKSCDIASGSDHILILTCNGKIYTVGNGEQGQLGRVSIRSASGDSRRGKNDLLTPGQVSLKGKLCKAIWATNYCSFAQEFTGSRIVAFGLNNYKQLTIEKSKEVVPAPTKTKLENIEMIAGGQQHTLVLSKDNKCLAIGNKDYGRLGLGKVTEDVDKLKEINFLSDKNVVTISCGDTQSFAITQDGKCYSWGMGSNLQLGTGRDEDEYSPILITSKSLQDKKIFKVSSGGQHTLFLIENTETLKNATASSTSEKANIKIKNNDKQSKSIFSSDEENTSQNKVNEENVGENNKKNVPKVEQAEVNKDNESNGIEPENLDEINEKEKPIRGRKRQINENNKKIASNVKKTEVNKDDETNGVELKNPDEIIEADKPKRGRKRQTNEENVNENNKESASNVEQVEVNKDSETNGIESKNSDEVIEADKPKRGRKRQINEEIVNENNKESASNVKQDEVNRDSETNGIESKNSDEIIEADKPKRGRKRQIDEETVNENNKESASNVEQVEVKKNTEINSIDLKNSDEIIEGDKPKRGRKRKND